MNLQVVPYKKDFTRKKDVLAAWNNDEEFQIHMFLHNENGKIVRKSKIRTVLVDILYNGASKVLTVEGW